ncbi:hypothetical protein [Moraxella lacunata]
MLLPKAMVVFIGMVSCWTSVAKIPFLFFLTTSKANTALPKQVMANLS